MRFLGCERAALQDRLPGLDDKLAGLSLADLEQPDGTAIGLLREAGGAGLLVPAEYGGVGADAVDAVRVQVALGSRSPSLAVASSMHHFSVASLAALGASEGMEWMLLEAIARQRLLVASGFAEGHAGRGILAPTIRGVARDDGGLVLHGSKKPCSLASSMDLLTASVTVTEPGGGTSLAVALIGRDSPGLSVRPFWRSRILAGAESEEVVLDGVEVPPALVIHIGRTTDGSLDPLQATGFLWFELLMAGSYLGVAAALVERVLADTRIPDPVAAEVAAPLEAVMAAVEGTAGALAAGQPAEALLGRALAVRYAAQDGIGRVTHRCAEALGGMAFIGSDDIGYLLPAAAALAFHPPSRGRSAAALGCFYRGAPLVIG